MSVLLRNCPVKRGQIVFARYFVPLCLAGILFLLMWLFPSVVRIVLWTLVLFSFLNRLLRQFNNKILEWIFIVLFLAVGSIFYLHVEKIESKTNDQISLQNKLLLKDDQGISSYHKWQRAGVRSEIHDFSASLVHFILPGKFQLAMITIFVLLLQLLGLKIFHIFLDKRSNSTFEFAAFIAAKVYCWLVDFSFYRLLEIAFVFSLWILALWLLQFDNAFEIALAIGLSTLTPIIGIWLGGLFPLFYLQASDKMTVQIIGVIITFAVMWLFRHIAIARIDGEQFGGIQAGIIPIILGAGYLFGSITGLLVVMPLFVFVRFLVSTFFQGKPLYKIQQASQFNIT